MSEDKKINVSGIGKGIIFSLLLTFLLMLLIAAVCYFANISDKILSILVFAATGLSVLFGAAFVAKNAPGSGLLHGVILGVGYLVVLLLSSMISQKGLNVNSQMLSILICVPACGMLGGVLGINSKN